MDGNSGLTWVDTTPPSRYKFQAGALTRRRIRAHIKFLGLQCQEYKGLFESDFVVVGPQKDIKHLIQFMNDNFPQRQ